MCPPQDYPHKSPDYEYTDKYPELVMVILCSKLEYNWFLLQLASRLNNIKL